MANVLEQLQKALDKRHAEGEKQPKAVILSDEQHGAYVAALEGFTGPRRFGAEERECAYVFSGIPVFKRGDVLELFDGVSG